MTKPVYNLSYTRVLSNMDSVDEKDALQRSCGVKFYQFALD